MALEPYSLEEAEEHIADLRGQVDRLDEYQAVGGITIDGMAGALSQGKITQDGWTTFTYKSGWSNRGAGFGSGKYRISPDGYYLELCGQITGSTGTAGDAVFATVPSSYCDPANERSGPCTINNSNLPGTGSPRVLLHTNGDLEVGGYSGSGVTVLASLDGTRIAIQTTTGA